MPLLLRSSTHLQVAQKVNALEYMLISMPLGVSGGGVAGALYSSPLTAV